MTIVIGIKCKGGIAIACDSRTTDPLGYVRDNAEKLHIISFSDGNSGIVAEAGHAAFSGIAIEKLSKLAQGKRFSDYRVLAECAQQAIGQIRSEIRDQNHGASSEELRHIFEEHDFELLIANYFASRPYIFTVSLLDGLPCMRTEEFCSIGCGRILADFIIGRLPISGFSLAHAIWISAYAVEEIKAFDQRCGGITRTAVINWKNNLSISGISEEIPTQEVMKEAQAFSKLSKENWPQLIEERIDQVIAARPRTQ